jgi:hypothetical protein
LWLLLSKQNSKPITSVPLEVEQAARCDVFHVTYIHHTVFKDYRPEQTVSTHSISYARHSQTQTGPDEAVRGRRSSPSPTNTYLPVRYDVLIIEIHIQR